MGRKAKARTPLSSPPVRRQMPALPRRPKTALSIIRAIRPAVAAIKDTGDRARVVDALVESIKGGEVMDRLNQAAQAGARRAADAAKTTNYDKICAEQQAEYYARNPHKKQEG